MEVTLPSAVICISKTLTDHGYTCEIVGGAVRDLLLEIPSNDWDFTTNATPEQIQPLFQESFYENAFGTVMVAHKHLAEQFNIQSLEARDQGLEEEDPDLIYDITTYRSDGEYRNHRKPETVTWGETLEEDLTRRDFTINALALRTKGSEFRIQGSEKKVEVEIIDLFNGQADLANKLIKTVGNPSDRFSEDALRMLRAVRFACQLGFSIEPETLSAITTLADNITHISWERISEEFMKIIASEYPEEGIRLLDNVGLLKHILPELIDAKGVRQSGHHIYDVWEHSLKALGSCTSTDPVVRLATLLHDIAKPVTYQEVGGGNVTFYNHEVVGARMAKQIAGRLRLSKDDCNRIFTLVRWHMFTYETFVTDAYIRRFIRRVGVENLDDIMALRIGDRVGSGSKATSWRLEELKDRIYAELHQPLKLTDMVVDGNDVMKELNVTPGPIIGKVLNELFEEVIENPENNTREYLLPKMQEYKNLQGNI